MNFLSHYYFDRFATPHRVMGALLPDLLKNAVKEVIANPLKEPTRFQHDPDLRELLSGWEQHLLVDKYFHNTSFFLRHTKALKICLLPITEDTPVRPSFLAHIALELILDHLLIIHNLVDPGQLYVALDSVPERTVRNFLEINGVRQTDKILQFISAFNSSKYLISYKKAENLSYALNRICMRLWPDTLSEEKIHQLDAVVKEYIAKNQEDLLLIFPDTATFLAG